MGFPEASSEQRVYFSKIPLTVLLEGDSDSDTPKKQVRKMSSIVRPSLYCIGLPSGFTSLSLSSCIILAKVLDLFVSFSSFV